MRFLPALAPTLLEQFCPEREQAKKTRGVQVHSVRPLQPPTEAARSFVGGNQLRELFALVMRSSGVGRHSRLCGVEHVF